MIVTSQMIRDVVFFNKGPMSTESLMAALKVYTPEDRAHVLTLVKLASQSKTISYNESDKILWVTKQQFKSCL